MTWTIEIVRARFIEAADTATRLPHVGHSSKSGFWPAYLNDYEDQLGWGTQRLAEERELRLKRRPPSAAALSRHDEVTTWAANHIEERLRHYVWAWALCRASERSFSEHCRKRGWVRLTAYRRKDRGFDQDFAILDKSAVLLRLPEEKWLIQERPDMACVDYTLEEADTKTVTPAAIIFPGQKSTDTLTTPQALKAFEKHLAKTNRARRAEQERRKRKLLGLDEAA